MSTRVPAPALAALAGAVLLAFSSQADAATPNYSYTALTSLNSTGSSAAAINNAGQITGNSYVDANTYHAVVWSNGTVKDLGTLGGGYSQGAAINSSGQVAGAASNSAGSYFATSWSGSQSTQLATLGGDYSQAMGINNAGKVVGFSYVAQDAYPQAASWNGTTVTSLGSLGDGKQYSTANAVNNAGVVAGASFGVGAQEHAVTWNNGAITDLGTLGGSESYANAINDAGAVVGYSSTSGVLNDHAVVWSGGTITDLGSAGMDGAEAFGINNLGQVVGYAWTGSAVTHAILWEDGAAIDLNSFLSASMVSQGWVLEHANGINDQGEIVGDAFNIFTSTTQAFLLATAVPEADTYAMLLAGLGLVGWMSRRRKAA